MRVLTVGNMYPPQHLGGYEVVWAAAVEHMREQGHQVTVLTTDTVLHDDAAPDPEYVHRELGWRWRDHEFPAESRRATLARERVNATLLRHHLDDQDAVMWWAMGGMSLGLIAQAAKAGVPAAAVVHDAWPLYGPIVDRWQRTSRLTGAIAGAIGLPASFDTGAVAQWSFNSAFVRDEVLAGLPQLDAARCRVDWPGIDAARFATPAAGPWAWRLACVGRIDPRKGVAFAIEALTALPDEATLVIAGGGDAEHQAELRALTDRLGLQQRVTFRGPVDDTAAVYAQADALVFPVTWDEPFGLVPLEAMASGRPVVATGTGGSGEYLRDGENSLLVTPGDAGAIAGAVRRLADDEPLRAQLVTAGLETARGIPQTAFNEAMLRLAQDVVSGDGRAARADR